MFNVCILEIPNVRPLEILWIEDFIYPITEFESPEKNRKVIAWIEGQLSFPERLFFVLSNPCYFKIIESKIIITHLSKHSLPKTVTHECVTVVKPPKNNSFISVAEDVHKKIIVKSWTINLEENLEDFFKFDLLIFKTRSDFETFKEHFEDLVCKNESSKYLMIQLKNYKSSHHQLNESNLWLKNQVNILNTSLSLLKSEYQKDLQWHKDELKKVIEWYKNNYEKLPRGFLWTGKKLNKLLSRINFLFKK